MKIHQKTHLKSFWLSLALLVLAAGQRPLSAQVFPRLDFPVRAGDRSYTMPLVGGLNNPQLSAADLNGDGREDLYVFDRTGSVHLPFLFDGSNYRYAPAYVPHFPELKNWVLLRDYNGDGAADLFAYSDVPGIDGIAVYQGFYEEGALRFRRLTLDHSSNLLFFSLPGGPEVPLFVSNIDYPAVDDVDCDGDLDVLTFNAAGGYVEFYQNQSVERGYGLDSLIFRRVDDCWGGFFESGITVEVELADSPDACAGRLQGEGAVELRHAGSTLLTLDGDGDGDRELILGDLSFSLLNYLHNAGSCTEAWMDRQEVGFPQADRPADLDFFPAAFHLDLDHDGLRDLAVAPNARQEAENQAVLWFYENVGTEAAPVWNFRQSDWLVGEMLDFGTGAHPAFFDYNGDGLLDLLVGNGFRYRGPGQRTARLRLFENRGTPTAPAFTLIDDNYLDVATFLPGVTRLAPAVADLDGDGDQDLLVGEEGGGLLYAENRGGPGNAVDFTAWVYPFAGIDVGVSSVPTVGDLNRDGLPDLVVGERDGNVNYFQNQGTAGAPAFDPDPEAFPNTMVLGSIDTRVPGDFIGYSAPRIVGAGADQRLITGSDDGRLEVYTDLADNLYGAFTLEKIGWGGVDEGARTRLDLADIDRDGRLELAVGNARGGLAVFRSDLKGDEVVAASALSAPDRWKVSPNPFRRQLVVETTAATAPGDARWQLLDLTGRVVAGPQPLRGERTLLQLPALPAGVYLLRIYTLQHAFSKKIVRAP